MAPCTTALTSSTKRRWSWKTYCTPSDSAHLLGRTRLPTFSALSIRLRPTCPTFPATITCQILLLTSWLVTSSWLVARMTVTSSVRRRTCLICRRRFGNKSPCPTSTSRDAITRPAVWENKALSHAVEVIITCWALWKYFANWVKRNGFLLPSQTSRRGSYQSSHSRIPNTFASSGDVAPKSGSIWLMVLFCRRRQVRWSSLLTQTLRFASIATASRFWTLQARSYHWSRRCHPTKSTWSAIARLATLSPQSVTTATTSDEATTTQRRETREKERTDCKYGWLRRNEPPLMSYFLGPAY